MTRPLLLLAIFFSQIMLPSVLSAQGKYWIFFKDKPNALAYFLPAKQMSAERYLLNTGVLSQRAIERRLKVKSPSAIGSEFDFPVCTQYLDSLRRIGLTIKGTSRWFNAASVIGDSMRLAMAEGFSFVSAIRSIKVFTNPIKPLNPKPAYDMVLDKVSSQAQPGDSSFYGPSYAQLELSGIPQVHSLGINGTGVLVGMLDAGFRYETHDALKNITIVGEHDFIQNDSITANQPGDAPDQDNHGTLTLSALGGYKPGELIGVAYGSDFMLAKTEYVPVSDFKWEEDNWVEGIEWMEARGVDVVSSSVAYNIFVDSSGVVDTAASYYWSRGDFNGRRALSSAAATRAAELGVVVVQAMGNEGNGDGISGTMDVPADADSIISVGAVDWDGALASFSSTGPTNDSRIKPDLVADGSSAYAASVPGPDTYEYVSGTSLSTPITAGVAALVLSVRPDFTPMQVIILLKSTAVQVIDTSSPGRTASYPNNFYGWGIVNAWNAMKALGIVGSNSFSYWGDSSDLYFGIRGYSTSGIDPARCTAYYSTDGVNYKATRVLQTDTANQVAFVISAQSTPMINLSFYFSIVDSSGNQLNVPYYGEQAPFRAGKWMFELQETADTYVLFNNFPNPFNSQTRIGIALKTPSVVFVDVYDVLGRKVRTIPGGNMSAGYHDFIWNGLNDAGRDVSSGLYLLRVRVGGSAKFLKMLYLK